MGIPKQSLGMRLNQYWIYSITSINPTNKPNPIKAQQKIDARFIKK